MSNSIIKLQADNQKFILNRIDNGQNGLYAEGNSESEGIEFEVTLSGDWPPASNPKINLKKGGTYVTLHGETVVLDNGASEGRDFEVFWRGFGRIALKGANGKFVSYQTDGKLKLMANRDQIGPWETFIAHEQ